MRIHCCGCNGKVEARLTTGAEVYPHRLDLHNIPFWRCDACGNFVGCHHKTKNRTAPLGCIPTPEIKKARMKIHNTVDPLWQSGKISRNDIYKKISDRCGRNYHTAKIRSVEEALGILCIVESIKEAIAKEKAE